MLLDHLNEAILMGTHNIHFYDKIDIFEISLNFVCYPEASEEFPRDSKTSSNQPL